jgi:hypothetical protein
VTHLVVLVRYTGKEDDRGIIRSGDSPERPLMPDADSVDDLFLVRSHDQQVLQVDSPSHD